MISRRHWARVTGALGLRSRLALSAAINNKIGSARATRQKPAAVLPTSISRRAAVVAPNIRAPMTTASTADVARGDVMGCRRIQAV